MFDFFTAADPTNGYVNYVDETTAQSTGLFNAANGTVYIGVDSTNVVTGSGRNSVRITSKNSYNHGLIILDLEHMPGGQCGTWPAFWMLGPNWPTNGELDIIENVNSATGNTMTLHTDSGCSISNTGSFSGTVATDNCDVNAPDQATNQGCAIDSSASNTYGAGFNQGGGGVYATEWTSESISIWHFPRSAIPADITSGTPDPSNWGLALSTFSGACDLDAHVDDMQIVFDTTFCGDWAGGVWGTDPVCAPLASTCQDYVQNNPSAFADTYWLVNSLKVYQSNGAAAPPSSSPAAPTATTTYAPTTSTSYAAITPTYSATTVYTPPAIVSSSTPYPSAAAPYTGQPSVWPSSVWPTTFYTQTWTGANTWQGGPPAPTQSWAGPGGNGNGNGNGNNFGGGNGGHWW